MYINRYSTGEPRSSIFRRFTVLSCFHEASTCWLQGHDWMVAWPWQSQANQQLLQLSCSWGFAWDEPHSALPSSITSALPKSTSSVPHPDICLLFPAQINQTFPTNEKTLERMGKAVHRDDLIRILFWPLKILWFFILGFLYSRIEKKLLWKLFLSDSPTQTLIYYLLIFVDVVSCNTEHTNKHVIPDEDYPGSYSLEMPEHSKNYKKQSTNVPQFSHGGFSFGLCCCDKLHDQINLGGKEFTLLTSYRPSQKKPKAGVWSRNYGVWSTPPNMAHLAL